MRIISGRRAHAPLNKAAGRRRMAAVALAAMGMIAASPALAETPATDATPAGMSDRVDVKVVGRIDSRCQLSGGGEIDLGELHGGEGARANFGLDCNLPFDIDIRSARGGLAHVTTPQGQGPFAGLLEYDLRISVPTRLPEPKLVEGAYTSRELLGRRTLSSGQGVGAGGGEIEFRMRQPDGAGLLAGRYAETLSLTITPRM